MTEGATQVLDRRMAIFSRQREERTAVLGRDPEAEAFLDVAHGAPRATIVLGSPRGGTSVLHATLRRAESAVAMAGEHRLLLTLLGRNFPDSGTDVECAEDGPLVAGEREWFLRQLLHECGGEPIEEPTAADLERFATHWALRFRGQWPEADVELEWLVRLAADASRRVIGRVGRLDPVAVAVSVIAAARKAGIAVNPYYYALPEALLATEFPGERAAARPPSETIVEITPFVIPSLRRRPLLDPCSSVVVKASSDPHRIPLLRALFAGWDITWVHLTRNPLAAVNGLLDGWAHHCYWQHDLSPFGWPRDAADDERARGWWCFDLMPGWRATASVSLVDVCGTQWHLAHERIFDRLEESDRVVRVRFEDFQAGGSRRSRVIGSVMRAAGLEAGRWLLHALERPPKVNETAPAAVARWRDTRPWLTGVLEDERIAAMATRMGYGGRPSEYWI